MGATPRSNLSALTVVALVAAALIMHTGCERRDENAASVQASVDAERKSQQNSAAPATRPTTQQLLEGPVKRIPLSVVPLTVEVPESWSVRTLNLSATDSTTAKDAGLPTPQSSQQQPPSIAGSTSALTELTGPAPSGDVHIQLAQRLPLSAERLERMLKAAQRDAEKKNGSTTTATPGAAPPMKFSVRQQPDGVRVMEQQSAMVQPDGAARLLDWRLTYFTPRTGGAIGAAASNPSDFDACELNFLGLTVEQYEHDHAFLQKIVDSVRYDPSGLTVAQPPASADPLATPPPGR